MPEMFHLDNGERDCQRVERIASFAKSVEMETIHVPAYVGYQSLELKGNGSAEGSMDCTD